MQVFTDIPELFETISSSVTKLHIWAENEENKRLFLNLANPISLLLNLSFHQWHWCWRCWLSSLHKGKPAA